MVSYQQVIHLGLNPTSAVHLHLTTRIHNWPQLQHAVLKLSNPSVEADLLNRCLSNKAQGVFCEELEAAFFSFCSFRLWQRPAIVMLSEFEATLVFPWSQLVSPNSAGCCFSSSGPEKLRMPMEVTAWYGILSQITGCILWNGKRH